MWVQRLGVEINTFLHDLQTCVIVTRGLFLGGLNFHLASSRARKRGIRTKTSAGNRLIGCRIDSSERSFGRSFVSNELLAAVIWKYSRES